jgi:hypothetical protein
MARSRGELEEIIKRGESVLLPDGRNVTSIADLPTAVELAGSDIVKKQQAVADLEAQRAALDKQIADALASKQEAKEEARKQDVEAAKEEAAPAEAPAEDKPEMKKVAIGRQAAK